MWHCANRDLVKTVRIVPNALVLEQIPAWVVFACRQDVVAILGPTMLAAEPVAVVRCTRRVVASALALLKLNA